MTPLSPKTRGKVKQKHEAAIEKIVNAWGVGSRNPEVFAQIDAAHVFVANDLIRSA